MHHIRRAAREELPTIIDEETLAPRPMTDEELRLHGIVPLGLDLYDVAHSDRHPEPEWGVKVVEGPGRFDRIPQRLRDRLKKNTWFGEG